MPPNAAFGEFLLAAVIALTLAVLIGVAFLRVSIAIYNMLVGGASSPNSVPVPEFERAALITCVTAALQVVVRFMIGRMIGAGAVVLGVGGKKADVVTLLISLPVSFLIMVLMLTALLPTTFGRALLVTMCYVLLVIIAIALGLAIASVVFGFELGLGAG